MRAHELVEAGRQHVATGRIREAMACFTRADDPERGAEALSLLAAACLLPGWLAPELALARPTAPPVIRPPAAAPGRCAAVASPPAIPRWPRLAGRAVAPAAARPGHPRHRLLRLGEWAGCGPARWPRAGLGPGGVLAAAGGGGVGGRPPRHRPRRPPGHARAGLAPAVPDVLVRAAAGRCSSSAWPPPPCWPWPCPAGWPRWSRSGSSRSASADGAGRRGWPPAPRSCVRCLTSNTCSSSVAPTTLSGRREPQGCPPQPSPSRVASTTSAPARRRVRRARPGDHRQVARERPDHRGPGRQDPRRRGPRHLPHPGQPRGLDPAADQRPDRHHRRDGGRRRADRGRAPLPARISAAPCWSPTTPPSTGASSRPTWSATATSAWPTGSSAARLARKLLPHDEVPNVRLATWPPTSGRRSPPATGP